MTVYNFPTLSKRSLDSFEFNLQSNTQTFVSPLNGQTQTLELPGAKWICTMSMQNVNEFDGRIIKAFLSSLRGASGRLNLGDLSHPTPSGTALGTGTVNGTEQTGNTLITHGWTGAQSKLFLPGDYFSVNNELKMITVLSTSDSYGNSTLTFEPPLRTSPTNGGSIGVSNPTCVMMLIDDKQVNLPMKAGRIFAPVISFTEVF